MHDHFTLRVLILYIVIASKGNQSWCCYLQYANESMYQGKAVWPGQFLLICVFRFMFILDVISSSLFYKNDWPKFTQVQDNYLYSTHLYLASGFSSNALFILCVLWSRLLIFIGKWNLSDALQTGRQGRCSRMHQLSSNKGVVSLKCL